MAYEKLKEYMNECMAGPRPLLGDQNSVPTQYVVAVTVEREDGSMTYFHQTCHSSLSDGGKNVVAMADHIQGGDRKTIQAKVPDDVAIRFLQYLMDHPIFKDSFLEHDAKVALEERIMMRDLSKLPSNLNQFAIIATRGLWETYQIKVPKRFCKFVDEGFNPDFAFILAYFVQNEATTWTFDMANTGGHSCLNPYYLTDSYVKNYVAHTPKFIAPGTMKEGVPYTGYGGGKGGVYGVNMSFEDKGNAEYNMDNPYAFRHHLEKGKLDLPTLKALEAQYVTS